MRNGILVAAVAAALALATPAAAGAATPVVTITPPATTDGHLYSVPYTLSSTDGVAYVALEMRAPGASDFHSYGLNPAAGSGTVTALVYSWPAFGVVEGVWDVRVTAYDEGLNPIASGSGTTRLDWQAQLIVAAPYFDGVPVGVTSGAKDLRIENFDGGPLRIRSVTTAPGSPLAVAHDGCAGQTLYGAEGCYVSVTFTAAVEGVQRGTLLVDANTPTKQVYALGNGIVDHSQPAIVYPAPTPAPATPTPPVQVLPPELSFGSAPGRTSTRLFGLTLDNVPAGSTVTVRCATGCAVKSYTKRGASGSVSLQRFAKRALKAGTKIRVTLAAPGKPARTATLTIRARREPKVSGTF